MIAVGLVIAPLGVLALVAVARTLAAVATDGYRRVPRR